MSRPRMTPTEVQTVIDGMLGAISGLDTTAVLYAYNGADARDATSLLRSAYVLLCQRDHYTSIHGRGAP